MYLYIFKILIFNYQSVIKTGYERDLTRQDLWKIDEDHSSEILTKMFEKEWNNNAKELVYSIFCLISLTS